DKAKTSPYKFYQYWINASDEDAANYIRIFTLKTKNEIEALEKEHAEAPHLRVLQKALGEDITVRVHSKEDLEAAINASEILFMKGQEAVDGLKSMSAQVFEDVFEGVPQAEIALSEIETGVSIIDALSSKTNFLKSGGEARRALKENSISVNKDKVKDDKMLNTNDLINGKYILLQRGKKNYFIVKAI
ncbi:MAG: tyrosine--tRNA ligase, partial [Vicingaceae bacterium]